MLAVVTKLKIQIRMLNIIKSGQLNTFYNTVTLFKSHYYFSRLIHGETNTSGSKWRSTYYSMYW
jgi:hypothetical protein